MGVFLTLRRHIWHYRWRYLAGILCLLTNDAAQLLIPQILRRAVDTMSSTAGRESALVVDALLAVALALVIFACRFGWRMLVTGTSRHIDYRLRRDLFDQFSRLSVNYFNRHKTGDLMAHATNDLNAVRMALGMGVVTIFDASFMIVSTVVIMFATVSPSLSALALLPLPFVAVTTFWLGRIIHRRFLVVQDAFAKMTDATQETISGIRVIKSYVQEESEFRHFNQRNEAYVQSNLRMMRVNALFEPLVDFIAGLSFCIALAFGGIAVLGGSVSLGDFVAFISYLGLLTWPMMAIGMLMNTLQRGAASLERINRILAERPEIEESPQAHSPSRLEGAIRIEHLSFAYDGSERLALQDISLQVGAGQTVGILGRTGSGKTTVLSLLLRLYDPPPGTVLIDDIDVRALSLKSLRENIGYVPPDTFLFSESIADNIAFGVDTLGEDAMIAATTVAHIHDSIEEFPDGYETLLGERGITLSGGQKQRVAIARALAKHPPLLILDDSLSAVDTRTEEEILSRLKSLRHGQTTLIVAHRTSTVAHADLIVVLDDGRLLESGTHEELMQKDGLYADMVRRQRLRDSLTSALDSGEEVGA